MHSRRFARPSFRTCQSYKAWTLIRNLQIVGAKARAALAQLSYLPRALRLVWQATHGWTIAWLALLLGQGILPVALVYLTRPLVDSIVAAAHSHGDSPHLRRALLLAATLAAVLLLTEILRSLAGWVRTAQSELLQDHISELIQQKSVEADLAFYESAEYHDHLHRARTEASYRSIALLQSLGSMAQNGLTLIAMAGVLLSFGLWLPLGLVLSTLPVLYVVVRYNLRLHQWRIQNTASERRAWYYDGLLTEAESAAEIRLFGLAGHFKSAFCALRTRLRNENVELAKRQSFTQLGASAFALLITASALGWVLWRAVYGLITLGELALFYQAFQQGLGLARSLLDNVGQLYANSMFLGNLFAFLALEPEIKDCPTPCSVPSRQKRHPVSRPYVPVPR